MTFKLLIRGFEVYIHPSHIHSAITTWMPVTCPACRPGGCRDTRNKPVSFGFLITDFSEWVTLLFLKLAGSGHAEKTRSQWESG